jgi:hypothetical protein
MRPEITHSLIKITAELAEILGIELHEEKWEIPVDHFLQPASLNTLMWSDSCCSCLETRTSPIFLISSMCLRFPVNRLTF